MSIREGIVYVQGIEIKLTCSGCEANTITVEWPADQYASLMNGYAEEEDPVTGLCPEASTLSLDGGLSFMPPGWCAPATNDGKILCPDCVNSVT